MKFIFSIIGAFIGLLIDASSGFFFGTAIGFLFGYCLESGNRLKAIEDKLKTIQGNLIDSNIIVDEPPRDGIEVDNIEVDEITITGPAVDFKEITRAERDNPATATAGADAETVSDDRADIQYTHETNTLDKLITYIKEFFTAGNIVVKVGVFILFFGVAFLLKYAAQHNVFPVEFWLSAVAVGATGLLLFGWRLRHTKRAYALVIQGGALGILYITLFTAARLFSVLPLVPTFFIMVFLVACSCLLAVLQDSKPLACLATIGGFLAPVLTATEQGSHIALFSYYALLNAGIFGIAWFKAWRILNWWGFVFTFIVASVWGHESYQADYFYTTEPFLILFFIFYVVISILFALKQPPKLKGLVDSSLVFGVPLVGFTLQAQLVQDYEYGSAISAFSMGLLYLVLAFRLWNLAERTLRLLAESFLALGVIFTTLSFPFALDGNWTATAWVLEGAGISWIGIRQKRCLARLFGLALQVIAGIIFLASGELADGAIPVLNSVYMGALLVSIAGLFSAFLFYKNKPELKQAEQSCHWLLLIWALMWWFCPGLIEIEAFVVSKYKLNVSLLFITLSMLTISLLARSVSWRAAEFPAILLLPAMYLFCLIQIIDLPDGNLLRDYGYISWSMAFLVQILILYRCDGIWKRNILSAWHSGTMYLYIFIACWVIADFVEYLIPTTPVYRDIVWGVVPTIGIMKCIYFRDRLAWPITAYQQSYVGKGLLPVVVYLGLWILITCNNPGDPEPLNYLPVLNPLEATQLSGLVIMLIWISLINNGVAADFNLFNGKPIYSFAGLIAFIWVTSVVARSVHYYVGITFDASAIIHSEIFQTSISIVWTLCAFTMMWISVKYQSRTIWFAGAGLLGIVVVKLFFIDLADTGTVTRIVSFMTVGTLMLVIGYLSPLPPKNTEQNG